MFFLYHRSTFPTGRKLARALGVNYGHLGLGQPPTRVRRIQLSLSQASALIRWGSQQALPSGSRPTSTLNSAEALSVSADKLLSLQRMTEAGLTTPGFSTQAGARGLFDLSTTVLGRSRHGRCGQDIQVFHSPDELTPCDFYTAYVPNTREYRIHVFKGDVIRIQGKYLDFPEQHTNEFIKNHGQGFRFRAPDVQLNHDRLEAAIGAVAAVGLDFGAVDLLIGEDRRCYVLEVNSAPACSPLTARAYVERMADWLGVTPNMEALEQTADQRAARPGAYADRAGRRPAYV